MKKCQRRVSNALDHNRTRCRWCRKSYRSSGAYSNHIQANHPQHIQTLYTLAALPQAPTLEKLHPDPPLANNADLYPPQTNNLEPYPQYVDSDHEVLEEVNDNDDLDDPEAIADDDSPCADNTLCTDEIFPPHLRAGASFGANNNPAYTHTSWNPFHPFSSEVEYKLARFFHRSKVPKSMVADFFKDNLAPTSNISFKSGDMLRNLLDAMIETPQWTRGEVDFPLQNGVEFFVRDIIACIRYLVSQPTFAAHMTWAPIRTKAHDGSRVYTELNTGEWWWETQVSFGIYSSPRRR